MKIRIVRYSLDRSLLDRVLRDFQPDFWLGQIFLQISTTSRSRVQQVEFPVEELIWVFRCVQRYPVLSQLDWLGSPEVRKLLDSTNLVT